jgi:hypothetical protein
MRSTQTWLLLVVTLALAGGLSAFLLATPDQGNRPAGDELGFTRLNEQGMLADLQHAEEYHREQHRRSIVTRTANRHALAWLRAVAGSGAPNAKLPANVTATAETQPFVRWADDIPRTQWKAAITKVEEEQVVLDATDAEDVVGEAALPPTRFVATGYVEVTVAQAANRTRHQRVPVVLTIEPGRAGAGGVPARWVLRDVRATGTSFVRAYADPVIEHRTAVDVVAPVADQALAVRLADDAQAQLPALVGRWRGVAGAGVATIWVLPNTGRGRAVLGHVPDADTLQAGATGDHGAAWVDQSGDIAVDSSRMRTLTTTQQLAALRHALTHVATRKLEGDAPALLAEGIARFEPRRIASPKDPLAGVELTPLIDAFGRAESGLAGLLVAAPALPLDTGAASTDQLAALATVAWIEDVKGHDVLVRLVTQLETGVAPDRALTSVLRLDARGVEVAVARWTREQADAADDETTATGDGTTVAADDTTPEGTIT